MNTILITGANRGIGKALVSHYLAEGFIVYAGTRNIENIENTHENVRPVQLDITDDNSIASAIARIESEAGHINILINNAGLGQASATNGHPELVSQLSTLDRSKLLNMFNVNAISALMVAKACVGLMTEADSFIVNISSIKASYDAAHGSVSYGYSASKAALNMETRCLVHDLPSNISTFAVHPGSVKTDMNIGGSLSPEESARFIADIINTWHSDLHGAFVNYDGTQLDKSGDF